MDFCHDKIVLQHHVHRRRAAHRRIRQRRTSGNIIKHSNSKKDCIERCRYIRNPGFKEIENCIMRCNKAYR